MIKFQIGFEMELIWKVLERRCLEMKWKSEEKNGSDGI